MQKPLLDYSEFDHVAPADLEIGRQVVRPSLGQMEQDKDISLSLYVAVGLAAGAEPVAYALSNRTSDELCKRGTSTSPNVRGSWIFHLLKDF